MNRLRASLTLLLPLFAGACSEAATPLATLEESGEFEPSPLLFHEVPAGTPRMRTTKLRNTGSSSMQILGITVTGPFTAQQQKQGAEDRSSIAAGGELIYEVRLVASSDQLGPVSGVLAVETNNAVYELPLSGTVADASFADLAFAPEMLDFGVVEVGVDGRRTVFARNHGNRDAFLSDVTLDSVGRRPGPLDVFSVEHDLVANPILIPARNAETGRAGEANFNVRFRADLEQSYQDTLRFSTDVGLVVSLPLSGTSAFPETGTVFCAPGVVDFGAVERGNILRQTVRCVAQGETIDLRSARITQENSDVFTLVDPISPRALAVGSTLEIEVEFAAEGILGRRAERLLVEYEGLRGIETSEIQVTAEVTEPSEQDTAIRAVLTWTDREAPDGSDLDLHLVRPGGRYFDLNSDCHFRWFLYGNQDWGAPGPEDDAFLDHDDTDGEGPEVINMTRAASGRYELWVHGFSPGTISDENWDGSDAQITVFIGGEEGPELPLVPVTCGENLYVGAFDWDASTEQGTFTVGTSENPSQTFDANAPIFNGCDPL